MENRRPLSNVERQEEIWQFIQDKQRATVADICEQFSVSEATARRDLDALVEQNRIQRVHGGAIALRQPPPELPTFQRSTKYPDEKKRIGAATAALVADNETIFLGAGTTVLEVARQLRTHRNLTVITNSLPVLNVFSDVPGVTLVCVGGMLRYSEGSFIGHLAEQALAELRADKVIIGSRSLDAEHGLTNDHLPETLTDRAILSIGREVIIVADHSKCGCVSAVLVSPITTIHTFVTDTAAPPDFCEALTSKGIRVLTV